MIVGFTGSRAGSTPEQFASFCAVVYELGMITEFHQGACDGWDEQATDHMAFARKHYLNGLKIIAHPGCSSRPGDARRFRSQRAIDLSDIVLPEKHFYGRNRDIAVVSSIGIAAPDDRYPKSGTGQCVGCFEQLRKPVIIVYPDGTVERSGGERE